ncbi:Mitochondrial glycoprotein family protein [Raphanus sativus]|uniref:Uncharacterized protein At2g39795, mitochondrial n=1 Tax=Raphanus sativus TaxID=3726 RepID=A0A6J0MKI0_RAPSA|nr:uncharacterized protein At2g39795, mitochondrial [Raphanus sativus]KAJ4868427.1 Mitochondrial glycoprotein family protein [Raphanus sativus]
MLRRVIGNVAVRRQFQRALSSKSGGSGKPSDVSAAVDSMLLRSLKEHYLEVSKMTPPPKATPPSPFEIVKGSLEGTGAVLKKSVGNEEISLFVMRLAHGGGDDEDEDGINQLFLHVAVSKPNQAESLHFLCGLYPDALGIHSVSMRPKLEDLELSDDPARYTGPSFEELDEKMRDVFHSFLEERGVNESLFPFLQAWLYVKDHRNLLRWFKSVGTYVHENPSAENA